MARQEPASNIRRYPARHGQPRPVRAKRATAGFVELPARLDDRTPDATRALADHDELEQAFRRLTPDQRTILALVYFADLSLADVSAALGIPLGTTKSRLHRSMDALRAALAADQRAPQLADGQIA